MKIFDDYKKMTVILAVLLLVSAAVTIITYPKNKPEADGKYQQVSVKVTEIEEVGWSMRFNRHISYEITVEYGGEKYELNTSTAPYRVGVFYNMYLYNGRMYRSVEDVELGMTNSQITPVCRIAMGIAFVSAIALIAYLSALIQSRRKKNSNRNNNLLHR